MLTIHRKGIEWTLDPIDHYEPQIPLTRLVEALGFIPSIISTGEGLFRDRINQNYQHGGGWQPFGAGEWQITPDGILQYGDPDGDDPDPPRYPLARARFEDEDEDEELFVYPNAWVAIRLQGSTESFEVSRLD